MTTRQFLNVAEGLGWSTTIDGSCIELSKFSPAGMDFSFCVHKDEDYVKQVYEYYENYDVSAKTMLWVDESGHGKNGAPYDLEAVLDDMKAIESMVKELYDAL